MPLSKAHKAESRRKILDAAAALFRRHGYEGVGIDAIMADAGLTRGGFYAHFKSKNDLLAAVLDREADFTKRLRDVLARADDPRLDDALQVIGGYLNPDYREMVAAGCSLSSLATDAARAGPEAQAAFARRLRELVAQVARPLAASGAAAKGEEPDPRAPDPRALAAVATCVGGLLLGKASGDDAIGRTIMDASFAQVVRVLRDPE